MELNALLFQLTQRRLRKDPSKVKVLNDQDFQLPNGTIVKAHTNIVEYFTIKCDDKTGRVSFVEMNQELSDIMNLPVNQNNKRSFTYWL